MALAAIAAAAGAATGAVTAEAVKRPATPTVVIIETDRQAAPVKNPPTVYSVSKEKPVGDPPKQFGRYVILDKDENVLEEKGFDLPANLYSDMIIKAVAPTGIARTAVPRIIEEPDQTSENSSSPAYVPTPYVIDDADAVKLTIQDKAEQPFSLLVDRASLAKAYSDFLGAKKPTLDISKINGITLDLSGRTTDPKKPTF